MLIGALKAAKVLQRSIGLHLKSAKAIFPSFGKKFKIRIVSTSDTEEVKP